MSGNRGTVVAQVGMVLTLAGLTGGALLLASCTMSSDPAPSAGASADASPGASAEPSAPVSPSASPAALPADCTDVVSEEVYAATFGDISLNDPGFGPGTGPLEPTPPPEGATPEEALRAATELFCVWGSSQADITQLTASFARADPAVALEYLGSLSAEGYTCGETLGGQRCQRVGQNAQYPVEEADTVFARDGVFIRVYQANFPTDNLLGSIVERIWG